MTERQGDIQSEWDYLRILGGLFHGSAAEAGHIWLGCSEAAREDCLVRIRKEGFDAFLRWKLAPSGVLGAELDGRLAQAGRQNLLRAMQDEQDLKRLFAEFQRLGIRFAPIKGIDLTFRIYPSPSLRPFGDWDIFFHPEDINRARTYLMEQGWREVTCSNQGHHHFAPLVKGRHFLEPHRTLSCFGAVNPLEIWSHLRPAAPGDCRHVLSPELNVLLLARHASEDAYRVIGLTKLLLDLAFVMDKEGIDWRRLRELSWELKQPYAGNLLAAFPEFFPAETVAAIGADPVAVKAYRNVFARRRNFLTVSAGEVCMYDKKRFSLPWLRRATGVLRPKSLRYKHHLPPRGAYWRMAKAYGYEFVRKVGLFFRFLCHRRPAVVAFLDEVKVAERLEKVDGLR